MYTETVAEIVRTLSSKPDQMHSAITGPGAFLRQYEDLTPQERVALGFSLHGMHNQVSPDRQPEILQARLSAWPAKL